MAIVAPWRFVSLVACLAIAGCGGKGSRAPVGIDDGRSVSVARKAAAAESSVSGYMFASVGERSIGPFFSRRDTGPGAAGLVAWLTVAEGTGRRVVVIPIDARGAPRSGETVVASVPVDTTMLVVRPMRGPAPGFLIAWTSLTDRGKSLWSVAVGDDGTPRAKPVELTRTTDDIAWMEIIPTDVGAACLWAEETRGGDANLVAAPLNTDGRVHGTLTRIATGIVGWHALELPTGIGVSIVSVPPYEARSTAAPEARLLRDARPGGALSFHRLDADARPTGRPATVTRSPVVSGDVEVARDGSRLVFAWTDRSTDEPSVSMAALDEKNAVTPPLRVAEARGGAALLGLASGGAGTAVMFEAPARRKGETRRVHVAKVGSDLVLERKPLSIEVVGRGQPELAATSTGFALLATTADCEPDSPACAGANAVATVLRTDAHAGLVQREPLTFLTDPATLGWGMTCEAETCFTLAASPGPPGTPSRIRTVAIHPRTNATAAGIRREPPPPGWPRTVDVTAVASGESVVDIATTPMGEGSLVALLTTNAEVAKGDESRQTGAKLSIRTVADDGSASAPSVITTRALPVGGVAIAGAEKPDDGGAVAWVARENGDPEVHVTRIDKRGRRTNDVQLTTTKGDAADVTITWAGGGWIVAWVDARDGNGEVYATKVSPELSRIAREERITKAPGDASDLVALARGSDVWLAWADPRESPKDGVADIFVSAVRMRDAKPVFDEQRVLATAAHSRTPQLSGHANGVYVAWIEEAPMGSETPTTSGYGAYWARLDATAKPAEKPARIPLAGEGAATSVAIETGTGTSPVLHAVVARSTADAIFLDGVDLSASPPKAGSFLLLDGPPSLDVALVLDRGVLYFNDDGPRPTDRRARRARIGWTAP